MKYAGRAISASLIGILMASGIVGLLTILNRPGSRTTESGSVDGRTGRIVQRELWIDETLLDLSEIDGTWDDATASGGGWASEDSAAGVIQPDLDAIRPYLEELSRVISGVEKESVGSSGAEN